MVRRLVALLTSLIFLHAMTAFACETVTAQQVADALNNAQGLQSGLKSCSMAAMAMIEFGGKYLRAQRVLRGHPPAQPRPDWSWDGAKAQSMLTGTPTSRHKSTVGSKPRIPTRAAGAIRPFSRLTAPIRRSMATRSQAARSRPASSSEPSSATTTSNRCNRPVDAAHTPMAPAIRAARRFAVGANMLTSRPPTRTAPSTDQRATVGRAAPRTTRHPARSSRQALGTRR